MISAIQYEVIPMRGYYEVRRNGDFLGTADTRGQADMLISDDLDNADSNE